jgi:hypothetical protein
MKIYKYDLDPNKIDTPQVVEMPEGARVLSAGIQGRAGGQAAVCVWAEVDPDAEMTNKPFCIAFTGSDTPAGPTWRHLSTLQAGGYVLHIYESMGIKEGN